MILKNKNGHSLYEGHFRTIKENLEYCAKANITLRGLCLRNEKIKRANLDGLVAPNADFWGCDFSGSDIGYANLKGADFRACHLENVCFCTSDLSGADMHGAYLGGAMLEDSVLDFVTLSCPSFWGCDLTSVRSLKNISFLHKGEHELVLNEKPLILRQKGTEIVIVGDHCLWRSGLYPCGLLPFAAKVELFAVKTQIEKLLKGANLQNTKRTMPKIPNQQRQF